MRFSFFLALLLFLNGCAAQSIHQGAPTACRPQEVLFVVSHGWHTGIVVNRSDLVRMVPSLAGDIGEGRYVEVGWGEERFYQAGKGTPGLALRALLHGPAGLPVGVIGAFAAGFPALILFRMRAMGGGDVKLLAGCGALLGPAGGLELLVATALVGGGMALACIVLRRAWAVTAYNLRTLFLHWRGRGLVPCPVVSLGSSRGIVLPYGLAIAGGMAFTFASHLGNL